MELETLKEILSTSESRQCAPLAPSHFVGPSPYAGVRRCQFRTSALTPIENLDCHHEASSCHPEAPSCHHGASSCHPEAPPCHHEAPSCHHEASSCHPEASSCHHEASSCHPERSEGSINLVLALGGGTVMTPECADIVKERACCVYLRASAETLLEHLSGEADGRPMLANTSPAESSTSLRRAERRGNPLHERITSLLAQRSATYEKTAHVIIDTDGKSIETIASEIFRLLNI